jgi:NAD(P)H-hydrate epimerase
MSSESDGSPSPTAARDQIADLLQQTGKDHHAAFFAVDGDDPDWPLWYAEHIQDRLPAILGQVLTLSELTYLMVDLDRLHRAEEPESEWTQFYARELIERYLVPATADMEATHVQKEVPAVTTAQMIEVDRAMIEEYQINLVQMMENAGRCLAHVARARFLEGDPRGKHVIILAGTGGNGGGALVAARRLANYGAPVIVFTTRSANSYQGVPLHQLQILQRMDVPVHPAAALESDDWPCDLIIDGIIGYSLHGSPGGNAAQMIRWANAQTSPILSLDVPSGLDGTSGVAHEPHIRASATITLALPKTGLLVDDAATAVGELYVADISVPPALYAGDSINLKVDHLFAEDDIERLR